MANRDSKLDLFDELIYGIRPDEIAAFAPGTSARRKRKSSPEAERTPYIESSDQQYAEKFKKEEIEKTLETAAMMESFHTCYVQFPGMSMNDEGSTVSSESLTAAELDLLKVKATAFDLHKFDIPERPPLAIDTQKETILSHLKKERAIVIKGFTGCGKTTRVAQFILDECYQTKTPCNIIVTQPRRIAAITISKRVCQERNWALGTVVGYQVGLESQTNPYTCLTYMTTRCLLEALVAKKSLEGYTHIIVDEVHERDEDTDLLLLVVRKFLHTKKTSAKVIVMSATAEAGKLAHYFRSPVRGVFQNAPIIEVEAGEPHPVLVYYMDDLQQFSFPTLGAKVDNDEPKIDKERYLMATKLISSLDEKHEMTQNTNRRHPRYAHLSRVRNAVLVFLPGLVEIKNMHKAMMEYENNAVRKNYWHIMELHSKISSEEQNLVFQPLPSDRKHWRKIILSTNIAESSVTVSDVTYVIDFCLVRQLVSDAQTSFCTLRTEWAPKSSCVQRRGRVGRVNKGVVYRMVSKQFYENRLPDVVSPEILRCPLEQAVLLTKSLDLGEPKALLALLIDPPRLDNIARTIMTLKEMGALFATANGKVTALDGDLSYLGHVISRLPIDVHLGKLIMLGYVFNVFEECIIMAAGLSSKNIFTSPYQQKLFAYQVKMSWAMNSFSDPITLLNVYNEFKNLAHSEYFRRSGMSQRMFEKKWAQANFIQLKALKEMDAMVEKIKMRLKSMGIEELAVAVEKEEDVKLDSTKKALLLPIVIFGAFYPNYFSRDAVSGRTDEREAAKSLSGLDPFSTVRLQGFPLNQPPKAYIRQIKNNMKDIFKILQEETWNPKISFDNQRVFIQFHQEGNPSQSKKLPSRICLPVYLAIKQKQLGQKFTIQLFDKRVAEQYSYQVEESVKRILNSNDLETVTSGMSNRAEVPYVLQIPPVRFPELHENEITVTVSHVEDPSHFWCSRLDDRSRREYRHINMIIGEGGHKLQRWDPSVPVHKGNLVMGPFQLDGTSFEYYRAKVLSVIQDVPNGNRRVRLYFIDFGNAAEAFVRDLRIVPDALLKFPPLAMECHLTGVGPSPTMDPHGKWTPSAKDWFGKNTLDKTLHAKVFSVVNGVASLDLITKDGTWDNPISAQMVALEHAITMEESYLSKTDHEQRNNFIGSNTRPSSYMIKQREREMDAEKTSAAELLAMEYDVPEIKETGASFHRLQGPYNPLEMRMYGKVHSLLGHIVQIDGDSVNSVMLDDQPGDSHERVLVAANIGTQVSGSRVMARSTTLLPNIPSLPAILTLLFAPRAEFRADATRTRLTGAICGLGYDRERNQSFYPEHDMEITFDTEISSSDVLLINKIRFWLNSVFGAVSYGQDHLAPSRDRMREVSQKSLKLLFQLIKTRNDVEVVPSASYKWDQVLPEHIDRFDVPESYLNTLIPQHDCIKLVP